MLIIHDLTMAYMEDVTPQSGQYRQKRDLEKKAFEVVLEKAPRNLKSDYKRLWQQFKEQKTPAARIAREADKLATLFQGEMYEEKEGRDIYGEHLQYYEKAFFSAAGKQLCQQLKKRHQKRIAKFTY